MGWPDECRTCAVTSLGGFRGVRKDRTGSWQRPARLRHRRETRGPSFAQFATDDRTDDEAQAERCADQAEAVRSLVRRGDVGHVGGGCGERSAGDTGNDATDEQVPDERRDRHHQVVKCQPEQGCQQHRAPAETIRQIAQHGREDELHEGVGKDQIATDDRCVGGRCRP